MYVKRNYRKPFFQDKNKGNPWVRRLLFLLLGLIILGATAWWQQDKVLEVAYEYLGPEMTPTPQANQLADEALELFLIGDMEAARLVWEEVIAIRSDNVAYLYEYGMLLIDLDDGRNDYAETALELAQKILEIDPNDPRGYALRARSLVWNGNYGLAIQVAQTGLDIAPAYSPLHAALSRAYIGDGDLRRGQEEGILAMDYAPRDVRAAWAYGSALMNSGAPEAITAYEHTISLHQGFLPPYFELAFLYLASNRDQAAIDIYNQILGVQPRNSRASLRLCEAYRKIGQFEQSRGLCEDAVTFDPSFVPAQFQLGLILYNERNFERSYEAFQTCLDHDSDNLQCTYYLGLTHYYLALTTYETECVPNRLTSFDCGAIETCQVGWDLLQDALVMAQSRVGTQSDQAIITEGLIAISRDPACAGIRGRLPDTLVEEATEEADL